MQNDQPDLNDPLPLCRGTVAGRHLLTAAGLAVVVAV